MIPADIVGALWILFALVWLISAFSAKRTLNRPMGPWLLRTLVIVVIVVLLSHAGPSALHSLFAPFLNPTLAILGVVLVALGIALAIWARFYLGRNWGMPASVKENPELVTTGPYRFIRHPIYAGMLLAMAGSALTAGLWWLVVLIIVGVYFIISARKEEALMASSFPSTYPAYKARTKMLIPFIY